MENLKIITRLTLYGLKDCVLGLVALKYFWDKRRATSADPKRSAHGKKNVIDIIRQCFVFAALFWIAKLSFSKFIVGKCIVYMMSFLSAEEATYASWVESFMSIAFELLWTWPLFLISRVLNYTWYQEIADLTFLNTGAKRKTPFSISIAWGDQITSTAIQCLFLLQGYLVFFFPIPSSVKHIVCTLHLSLLYALYAFEYKWIQMGWSMNKRLAYLEAKWPYFVGFGLPLAVITSYVGSYIVSMCIFSTFFPIYVISSTVTFNELTQKFSWPIRFFGAVKFLTNIAECYVCRFLQR